MASKSIKEYALAGLKIALTLVIIYFVWRQVASRWSEIEAYDWQLHWGYLAVSFALGLAALGLQSSLWRTIIGGFGHRLRFAEAYRIFYLSNLGRYIPGKVWQLFGILYLARQRGIPADRATASFLAVQMFAIPSSFLVFAVGAMLRPEIVTEKITLFSAHDIWYIGVVVIAISLFVVLWPGLMFQAVDRLLAKVGSSKRLGFAMSRAAAMKLFLGYVVAWTGYGLAFWTSVMAVTGGGGGDAIEVIGAFNGAYQIGYIALFAPGGLGPRELVLGLMLTPAVGAIAPAVAVIGRIWSIVLETIAALVALAVGKGRQATGEMSTEEPG